MRRPTRPVRPGAVGRIRRLRRPADRSRRAALLRRRELARRRARIAALRRGAAAKRLARSRRNRARRLRFKRPVRRWIRRPHLRPRRRPTRVVVTYPGPYWSAPLPVWTDDAPAPLRSTWKRKPRTHSRTRGPLPATRTLTPQLIKRRWIRAQVVNARRHLGRLTPFKREQYGTGLARPKEANVQAANALLKRERARQMKLVRALGAAGRNAEARLDTPALSRFARLKDKVAFGTRQTEAIWHFYDDLFGQRRGALAGQLAAMDRIALDCYQTCYMGLGRARSLPTPPPFAFMEAASPATYRRGVVVPKLARRENPFPLVRLPFHRLMNPWSLGAVPHEIGHNLHADLKLWSVTPQLIRQRLAQAGRPAPAQATWARWHKEIYADLIGVLLIGPYYIESLLDVIAKSPARVARFRPKGVHPVSYLRPYISTELLRRIGFERRAAAYDAGWRRIYPDGVDTALPSWLRDGFRGTAAAVVDVLCFKPMSAYGGKSLSQVVRFRPQDMITVREAAERLANGTNPGIAPERFFICAAREALDRRLAPPEQITRNFYTALTGR